MIAAGASRSCAVPIRTIATFLSHCISLSARIQRICSFTLCVYSNQVQTGKTEQINEVLRSILDFLI